MNKFIYIIKYKPIKIMIISYIAIINSMKMRFFNSSPINNFYISIINIIFYNFFKIFFVFFIIIIEKYFINSKFNIIFYKFSYIFIFFFSYSANTYFYIINISFKVVKRIKINCYD